MWMQSGEWEADGGSGWCCRVESRQVHVCGCRVEWEADGGSGCGCRVESRQVHVCGCRV
jgi:hypothetical protein